MYHSSAFWALMLPLSVSTMASDVLRGYWGQRLLWEIGGYVVVYPPTIHRYDRIEAYPFSEEKDFHANVGRLIKSPVSWRSNKYGLFDKILELSYAIAEEGFWIEKDLKFTAACLQDLLAVGYQQPKLMSLELDMGKYWSWAVTEDPTNRHFREATAREQLQNPFGGARDLNLRASSLTSRDLLPVFLNSDGVFAHALKITLELLNKQSNQYCTDISTIATITSILSSWIFTIPLLIITLITITLTLTLTNHQAAIIK
ncbi:hypothetical protein SLEP1_g56573 [Rubroshorea leprosula]|uniref:Uncharacterized protein n=1 Tax=Rubroshorea leprosula TaxID=152421 RepID=A0AAV5MIW6_9ROSI|nr:hypothetical protein SLEP1_g56573 [Rubroshorea leprosula]